MAARKKVVAKRKKPLTLEKLLELAAGHGTVSLTTTMLNSRRHGWVCYIRPHKTSSEKAKWAVGSWGGQGPEPREAVVDAIAEAETARVAHFKNNIGSPVLGGAEFDG
jgi:hypothetical protein